MENVFQEVIREATARGATVLLSNHILAEVEQLADRLSIIRDGVTVRAGTLNELRAHARTEVRATLERPIDRAALHGLHDAHVDGARLTAAVDSDRVSDALARLAPYGIVALTVEPPSLESLFLDLYEDR